MIPKGPPIVTLTNKEIRAIQEKARLRKEHREFLIKERSNPFRAAASNGMGFIEDPAFVRFEASRSFATNYQYFKPTMRTTALWLGWVIGPMIAIGAVSMHFRMKFENKCRRGEIAYRDRNNKFVY